jgi:uncharacterized membrane protein (DUF485 family)
MARTAEPPPDRDGVVSTEGEGAGRSGDGAGVGGSAHHPEIDWEATERSPEFRELITKRRAFVLPALGFVFLWYFGFIALAGYAPDFMGERITGGFTVGYALALSQFLMTWFLGWLYLRQSDRVFDPLARKASERALSDARASDARSSGVRSGQEVRG